MRKKTKLPKQPKLSAEAEKAFMAARRNALFELNKKVEGKPQ